MSLTKNKAEKSFFVFVQDKNSGKIKKLAVPSELQVGLINNPTALDIFGRLAISTEIYQVNTHSSDTIFIKNSDTVAGVEVIVAPISNQINVIMPNSPKEGQLHFIKDVSLTAAATTISISCQNNILIDGASSTSLVSAGESITLCWIEGQWRKLSSGGGGGGGGGAPIDSPYLVAALTPFLSNERSLTGASGQIATADGGPNSNFVLSLIDTAVSPGIYTNTNLTVDSKGRITAASNGLSSPIHIKSIASGDISTGVALSGSKLTIGATYFNPTIITAFGGTPQYFWRSIIHASEPLISAAIDLYDLNGIVTGIPGIISNSTISSSNLSPTFFSVDLTTQLSSVTGSGIFEARIWKTVSGSITSSISCKSAGIEIEF